MPVVVEELDVLVLPVKVVVLVLPVKLVLLVLLVVEVVVAKHSEQPPQYQFSQAASHPPCMVLHTAG